MIEPRELIWFDSVDLLHRSERTFNRGDDLLVFR